MRGDVLMKPIVIKGTARNLVSLIPLLQFGQVIVGSVISLSLFAYRYRASA